MKSYGTYNPPETVGLEFIRMAVPSGRVMPRAPVPGELFNLEVDMPEPTTPVPWYCRGTYAFDGISWKRLNDGSRQRKSALIGSRDIEVERATSTANPPAATSGYAISTVLITPSNRKACISGSATLWVDHTKSGHVWVACYRGTVLVGLVAEYITAGQPRTLGISFMDHPGTIVEQLYTLKIDTDSVGFLHVNQCTKFVFDGMSATALTVTENT